MSKFIPKIIHYCWFGKKPLPSLAVTCIQSWKKYFPDYEIKQWDEDNYNVNIIDYTSEAYTAKKYAFVSDYARFDILYNEGGIYFDTDVEVIKNMQKIIDNGSFAGLESMGAIAAGLGIGCPPGLSVVKEILDSYKISKFINKDGSENLETVVSRVSKIFKNHGFIDTNQIQMVSDFSIYPIEFFCPISIVDGKLRVTNNTYTIHHYAQSWQPKWRIIARKVVLMVGGDKMKKIIKKFLR